MESPEPTEQDIANARIRRLIAERQQAEYLACLSWALQAFGPGWLPSCRHFLVEKEEEERVRYTSERPTAAATVYTVQSAGGHKRHFTIDGGQVHEHESYEARFGTMQLDPHPTRGFEHAGHWCRIHRYSLCWAPYDHYQPMTAEQLAKLRVTREQRKAQRQHQQWAEDNPLLDWAGLHPDD